MGWKDEGKDGGIEGWRNEWREGGEGWKDGRIEGGREGMEGRVSLPSINNSWRKEGRRMNTIKESQGEY